MAELEELKEFLGAPTPRRWSADDWTAVESYIGSPLPSDFKAFMDAYGTGVIAEELVVFHPHGSSPLLDRMVRIHESFTESRARRPDDFPHPFHPEAGGLISWGYDYGGDEHFFLPCDPDPDHWKIITMAHEEGCEVFDGPFTDFILAFVERLEFMDEDGNIGPALPSFEAF
ncbi:SMI1/KNR4 family protein [Streptomyces sp. NPDC048277]|uniref:SMI1/KNR4 family protein n=1 Tax=Streptomyces sp. NPDC048277 TaxID=3155027 RepID=UPI0033E1A50D